MSPRIADVLRELTGAELRSDVQISDYRKPHNLDLLKHYIFTPKAPAIKKSSVELLHTLCKAFGPGVTENRFAIIANYGHGKSHFALAVANYFGKPFGSPESTTVLKALEHAIPEQDRPIYGELEDFKRQHRPFLVLLLRGDEPSDLPTKLHRELQVALSLDEDREVGLPFWFADAERFLEKTGRERRDEANSYLARHNLDLDSLLAKVRDRQAVVREICMGLVQELTGVHPQFERGLSLAEVVDWVVSHKCGAGKPYAGLLILFDEFSAFVGNYSRTALPGAHLQDLLNGVANARGRAVFVAFSQHDPNEIAQRVAHGVALDNIRRELDRLPMTRRYQLHSSLEEVLGSYLSKSPLWDELLEEDTIFSKALEDASIGALQAFRKRYLDDLTWGSGRFHDGVTLGCYPLHPLTTALLCSVELHITPNPRSVLGFVQEAVCQNAGKPVRAPEGPTWVRAIALVDHFKEMLGDDHWRLYKGALSRLRVIDEPEQEAVLKAMLLIAAGNLSTARRGLDKGMAYATTVAELSGLPLDTVNRVLAELAKRSIIRRDSVTGDFAITPSGWGDAGERIAQGKAQQVRLDAKTLEERRGDLDNLGFGHLPIPTTWGHQDDWCAVQILVERATLTSQYLKGVCDRYVRWTLEPGAREKARCLVVWLIAANDDDVEWYRANLAGLIAQSVGQENTPLVVMRPNKPSTEVIDRLKRYVALKSFTAHEKAEAEHEWYTDSLSQAELNLRAALGRYFENDCEPAVPAAFKAQLAAAGCRTLNAVLREIVRLAYPYGPRTWFDQYRLTKSRLAEAVSGVCSKLIQSGKIDSQFLRDKPIAHTIALRYLIDDWQCLGSDGRPRIPPQSSAVSWGWKALDDCFSLGRPSASARPVIEKLLNPPFGYDWNTLALLFVSWWSHHRYDIEIIGGSWQVGREGATQRPREFLEAVARSSLRRREDPTDDIRRLVRSIRAMEKRGMSQAENELRTLREFSVRDGIDTVLREQVRDAVKRLEEAVSVARDYDNQVNKIRLEGQPSELGDMLSALSQVRSLPAPSVVTPEMPAPEAIRDELLQRVEAHIDKLCLTCGSLTKLEDYALRVGYLRDALRRIEQAGLANLQQRLREGVQALEAARKELETRHIQEVERQRQESLIQSVASRGPMSELRRGLATLEAIEPATALRSLWERKRRDLEVELARLADMPRALARALDEAGELRAVNACRENALRGQTLLDEDEARDALGALLGRCEAIAAYFEHLEEARRKPRSRPEDYRNVQGEIRELVATNAQHLSAAQRAVAERVVAEIESSLAERRRAAAERLSRLERERDQGQEAMKIQRELESADWTLLPDEAGDRLRRLRSLVQEDIDKDEAQQVELHFVRIRDLQGRRRCLERLQQLIQESL